MMRACSALAILMIITCSATMVAAGGPITLRGKVVDLDGHPLAGSR